MRLRESEGIGKGRDDILPCDPAELHIIEGYNVRDLSTPEARAELDELKALVKQHGIKTPLVVRFFNQKKWIIEGHRRHKVVMELRDEYQASDGAEGRMIDFVPIMAEAQGTSDIDRDFGLETSNSGARLKPLELANLIYRLREQRGLPLEDIAVGLGKSLAVVKNHLEMRGMSEPIKEHVRKGDISATLAKNIAKGVDPVEAEKIIKANLEENARIKGKPTKVTAKTLKRDKPKPTPKPEPAKEEAPPAPIQQDEYLVGITARIPEPEPPPALAATVDPALTITPVRQMPAEAFQPPPVRSHDVNQKFFAIIARLATIAEESELNERSDDELIGVPAEVLKAADRAYRDHIGDTSQAA